MYVFHAEGLTAIEAWMLACILFYIYVFQAEGLTAIEAWMLACILFVFAALAEYAALLFHKSKILLETPVVHTQYQVQILSSCTYTVTGTGLFQLYKHSTGYRYILAVNTQYQVLIYSS